MLYHDNDRNTINQAYYQFYFNKLLTLKGVKIQNDVLTQEKIKVNGFRLLSTILGIISPGFMIYNYIYPDTTVKTAGVVAMGASSMFNRAITLVNYGYGEDVQSMLENHEQSSFADDTKEKLQEEYVDEEMGTLNRKGQKYLNRIYVNIEEFREEIVNFVRDKTELDLEVILDRRYKTSTLNTLGKEYLAICILSKDNTKDFIEILAKFAGFDQL